MKVINKTDGRTDGRTDRRTDEQGESSIPPLNFVSGGIIMNCTISKELYNCQYFNDCKQEIHLKLTFAHFCKFCTRPLTYHLGRVVYICVNKLWYHWFRNQTTIWINTDLFSVGTLGTNLSEISTKIQTFTSNYLHLMSSAKWWPFCLTLNVLIKYGNICHKTKMIYSHHTWQWISLYP